MSTLALERALTLTAQPELARAFVAGQHRDIIHRCGNTLVITSASTQEQQLLRFPEGLHLDTFCLHVGLHLVAVALHGTSTQLRLYNYPQLELVALHETSSSSSSSSSVLEWTQLAFSEDGSRVIGVSTLVELRVVLWDVDKKPLSAARSYPWQLREVCASSLDQVLLDPAVARHPSEPHECSHLALLPSGLEALVVLNGELHLCSVAEQFGEHAVSFSPINWLVAHPRADSEEEKAPVLAGISADWRPDEDVRRVLCVSRDGVIVTVDLTPADVPEGELPQLNQEVELSLDLSARVRRDGGHVSCVAAVGESLLLGLESGLLLVLHRARPSDDVQFEWQAETHANARIVSISALRTGIHVHHSRSAMVVNEAGHVFDFDLESQTASPLAWFPPVRRGHVEHVLAVPRQMGHVADFVCAHDDNAVQVVLFDSASNASAEPLVLAPCAPVTVVAYSPCNMITAFGTSDGVFGIVGSVHDNPKLLFSERLFSDGGIDSIVFDPDAPKEHPRVAVLSRTHGLIVLGRPEAAGTSPLRIMAQVDLEQPLSAGTCQVLWSSAHVMLLLPTPDTSSSALYVLSVNAVPEHAADVVDVLRLRMLPGINLGMSVAAAVVDPLLTNTKATCVALQTATAGLQLVQATLNDDEQVQLELVLAQNPVHSIASTCLDVTADGLWFVSGGRDGVVAVLDRRQLGSHDDKPGVSRWNVHSHLHGVASVMLSSEPSGEGDDITTLISCGADGGILAYSTQTDATDFDPVEQALAAAASAATKSERRPSMAEMGPPTCAKLWNASHRSASLATADSRLYGESHRFSASVQRSESSLDRSNRVQTRLQALSRQLAELKAANEEASELEHLPTEEFACDLQSVERMREEGITLAEQLRLELQDENVGAQLISERIRATCAEPTEEPLCTLVGINDESLQVSNFTTLKPDPARERRVRKLKFLRQMEIMERQWARHMRQDDLDMHAQQKHDAADAANEVHVEEDDCGGDDILALAGSRVNGCAAIQLSAAVAQATKNGIAIPAAGQGPVSMHIAVASDEAAAPSDPAATQAAVAPAQPSKAIDTSIVMHDVELVTRNRCTTQVLLLQEVLRDLQHEFNARFRKAYMTKQHVIEEVNERIDRILTMSEELWILRRHEEHKQREEAERVAAITARRQEREHLTSMSIIERKRYEREQKRKEAEEAARERNMSSEDAELELKRQAREEQEARARAQQEEQAAKREFLEELRKEQSRLSLAPCEEFGREFEVHDDEIQAEKVVSAEEAAAREAERAKKAAMASNDDDGMARALQDMMGGRLETERGMQLMEDELVREDWMDELTEAEMTEEQKQALAVFQRREQFINNEKQAHMKTLNSEIKKLKTQVGDTARAFDQNLSSLLRHRVRAMQLMYQCELQIARLLRRVTRQDALEEEQHELQRRLEEVSARLLEREMQLQECRIPLEDAQVRLDAKQIQEKAFDKRDNIRREFGPMLGGQSPALDAIVRLFRKRKKSGKVQPVSVTVSGTSTPRGSVSPARGSAQASELGVPVVTERRRSSMRRVVFHDPMQTLRNQPDADPIEVKVRSSMGHIVRPDEVLDEEVWQAVVQRIENRVAVEIERRHLQAEVADKQQQYDELEQAVELCLAERAEMQERLRRVQYERYLHRFDAELMLLVSQGIVELDETASLAPSCDDAILIENSVVQRVNEAIHHQGAGVVETLKLRKSVAKRIRDVQWRRSVLQLALNEAQASTRQVQLLRVTKGLQEVIRAGGHDSRQAAEVHTFERRVKHAKQRDATQQLKAEKQVLTKVKAKIRQYERENEELQRRSRELEETVRERQRIAEPNHRGEVTRLEELQEMDTQRELPSARLMLFEESPAAASRDRAPLSSRVHRPQRGAAMDNAMANMPATARGPARSAMPTQKRRPQQQQGALVPRPPPSRRRKPRASENASSRSSRQRHQRLVEMRQLKDTVRAQQAELAALTEEQQRLRKRSFPEFNESTGVAQPKQPLFRRVVKRNPKMRGRRQRKSRRSTLPPV